MEELITLEYDDTAFNVIEKVNYALRDKGLKFVCDNLEHDGFEIYTLVENKSSQS